MLPNIYAIDLQIRRFCSNNKERREALTECRIDSGSVSTVVCVSVSCGCVWFRRPHVCVTRLDTLDYGVWKPRLYLMNLPVSLSFLELCFLDWS